MKILFADSAHPYLFETLTERRYTCINMSSASAEEVKAELSNYDGIVIRSKFKLTAEVIDLAQNLKFIARVGAGMENIDTNYAQSKGISCFHAPEGNRNAVGEQALGMLLSLTNNIRKADQEVREGMWIREGNRGHELEGKTVGIIGFGNTGQAFARKLSGFDVNIIAYDPYIMQDCQSAKLTSMVELYETADILSLHIPLTDETNGLVNSEWLSKFKKPIWFINTARGKCVKTQDLLDAIDEGKVRAAALDVLEFESLSFEDLKASPELISRLRNHDKLLLTPHIAGWTFESHFKMARILVDKITGSFKPLQADD